MLLIYRYVEGLKLTCQNECRRLYIYMANCILHVPWLFQESKQQCSNSDGTCKNNRQMEMQSKSEHKSNQELNKLT